MLTEIQARPRPALEAPILLVLGKPGPFQTFLVNALAGEELIASDTADTRIVIASRGAASEAPETADDTVHRLCRPLPGLDGYHALVVAPIGDDGSGDPRVVNWTLAATGIIVPVSGAGELTSAEQAAIKLVDVLRVASRLRLALDISTWTDDDQNAARIARLNESIERAIGEKNDAGRRDDAVVSVLPDPLWPELPSRLAMLGDLAGLDPVPAGGAGLLSAPPDAVELERALRAFKRAVARIDDPTPRVSFVGPFNAGKTTIINRIVGASLPVGPIATTMAVTRIAPGGAPGIRIRRDGPGADWQEIDEPELGRATRDEATAMVEIIADLPLPFSVSDTPGAGDRAEVTARTLAELDETDLAVAVIDADKLLSEAEAGLIDRAQEVLGGNVLLVVSRLSVVDEADRGIVLGELGPRVSGIGNELVDNSRLVTITATPWQEAFDGEIACLRDRLVQLCGGETGRRLIAVSRLSNAGVKLEAAERLLRMEIARREGEATDAIAVARQHQLDDFYRRVEQAREAAAEIPSSWQPLSAYEQQALNFAFEKYADDGRLVLLGAILQDGVNKTMTFLVKQVDLRRTRVQKLIDFTPSPLKFDKAASNDPFPEPSLAAIDAPSLAEDLTEIAGIFSRRAREAHEAQRRARVQRKQSLPEEMRKNYPSRFALLRSDLDAYAARVQDEIVQFSTANLPTAPTLEEAAPEIAASLQVLARLQWELQFERERLSLLKGAVQ